MSYLQFLMLVETCKSPRVAVRMDSQPSKSSISDFYLQYIRFGRIHQGKLVHKGTSPKTDKTVDSRVKYGYNMHKGTGNGNTF